MSVKTNILEEVRQLPSEGGHMRTIGCDQIAKTVMRWTPSQRRKRVDTEDYTESKDNEQQTPVRGQFHGQAGVDSKTF